MNIQSITPEQVTKAYSGKRGCCMCGCKGNYYVRTESGARKVNPAQVTRILRIIQANAASAEVDDRGAWVSFEQNERIFVVYIR